MGLKTPLLLFGVAVVALVIFATAYQYALEHRAKTWVKTHGRILSAKAVTRKVRMIGYQGHEMRNFPEITYSYQVDGRNRRGKKIRLGEDIGNTDVAAKLARYPEGAEVVIHYNPANPAEAVLEREAPAGVYRTLVIFIAGCIAFLLAAAFGTGPLAEAIADNIPRPGNFWAVALFGGFGIFTGMLALAGRQEINAMKSWQPTWGRIESAGVGSDLEARWHWSRYFYATIVYSYVVDGHRYSSNRVGLGRRITSELDPIARFQAARFYKGQPIEVYYDPANPTMAILNRNSWWPTCLGIVSVIFLALAARAAGFL